MFGQTYLRIHPYHQFLKFQVFFNIQHVCIIHFRFQFCIRMYVRITIPKFHMKVRRQTNPWHHVLWATLRSIVLCCGQSLWTWKRCGQHWGHPARLKGPHKNLTKQGLWIRRVLLSHSPVFLFYETSEHICFQGRTAWKLISNRSKILVAWVTGKKYEHQGLRPFGVG